MGWSADDLRDASLAEVWSHWIGYARTQGWFAGDDGGPDTSPEAVAELEELMALHPDQPPGR